MDIEDASASWSLVLARSQLRIDSALDVLSDDLAPSSDERSYSVDGGGLIGLDVGADSAEWSRIERTERILARSLVVCLNGDETGGGNRTLMRKILTSACFTLKYNYNIYFHLQTRFSNRSLTNRQSTASLANYILVWWGKKELEWTTLVSEFVIDYYLLVFIAILLEVLDALWRLKAKFGPSLLFFNRKEITVAFANSQNSTPNLEGSVAIKDIFWIKTPFLLVQVSQNSRDL